MNVAQMQQQIQDLGYTSDTAQVQLDFLNAAYREIHSRMRWPFLEAIDNTSITTVQGTASYALPNTLSGGNLWRNIDAVRIAQPSVQNYVMIDYKQPQDLFDMLQTDQITTATPRYWTRYANQLWFYPTPDAAYNVTIYYIQEPPDLVASIDVPLVPLAYHDAIVAGAVCRITFRERDWIGLELWTQKYEQLVTRLIEEYLITQRQTSSEVKSSGWWNTEINYPLSQTGF